MKGRKYIKSPELFKGFIERLLSEKIRSGFPFLDHITRNFRPGSLTVLGGVPNIGKTSLVLCVIKNIAIGQKLGVGLISAELSPESVVERLLTLESGVHSWKLRTGYIGQGEDEDDVLRIEMAIHGISASPVFLNGLPAPRIGEVEGLARELCEREKISMLIVDAIDLIRVPGQDVERDGITAVLENLKNLAVRLNVPILATVTLPEDKFATLDLNDWRQLGDFESFADHIVRLYSQPEDEWCEQGGRFAKLMTERRRPGRNSYEVDLLLDPSISSWREVDRKHNEL